TNHTNLLLHHVREILTAHQAEQLSDRELLRRFAQKRDQAAFATLVRRHGPMILSACQRVLRNWHDAEDAFQATFMVLARKADSRPWGESVGTWLYLVAYRLALKVRASRDRRLPDNLRPVVHPPEDPLAVASDRELCGLLDEELSRLPAKCRAPLVLCALEGLKREEAARHLGWSLGTFRRRLEQGRALLRQRLERRGLALSAICAAVLGTEEAARATLPLALTQSAIHLATGAALGKAVPAGLVSSRAAALADGALKGMWIFRVKLTLAAVLVMGIAGAGVEFAFQRAAATNPDDQKQPKSRQLVAQEAAKPSGPQPVSAQESVKRPAPVLAGTVVTPDSRPAPGVAVSVIGGTYDAPPKIVDNQTTDEQGRFAFREVTQPSERTPGMRLPVLIAHDGQGRISRSHRLYPRNLPNVDIKLKLQATVACRGHVTDAAGQPIAGAEVVPLHWNFASFRADFGQRDAVEVPQELAAEFATKTDASGNFVLQGVPVLGGIIVCLRAAGFGSPWISFDAGQPVSIRLERAGSVAGMLTAAEDQKAATGVQLTIRRQFPAKPGDGTMYQLIYFTEGKSQLDGSFRFGDVPPGSYVINPSVAETLPYYAEPTARFEIKPGSAITGLSIPLHPAVPVRGRVLDKESGAGIKDVSVMLSYVDDRGGFRYGTRVQTGVDGRYTAYVKPGKITAQVQNLQGYLSAQGREGFPQVEASKPVDYPDLTLIRTATLTGVVVDETGKPAPAVKVYRVTRDFTMRTGPADSTITDAQGKFLFADVDPLDNVPLRARTATAATAATTLVSPEGLGKPVRLAISPKNASRLRGTVVDQAGRPIRDAAVTIEWHFDLQSRRQPGTSTSAGLEKHRTDAQGRFETQALWPGETYRVKVSAEGYGNVDSTQVQAKVGQVHDFHNIVLPRTGGIVQGEIVDSRGMAVPGVLVFNNGDGPQPVQTQSDASGRFRLDDLYQGGVFICARKEGYRFTAKRAVTDGPAVTIRLVRMDEPLPQPKKRAQTPSFEEERQVARQLLEKLWALPLEAKRTSMRTLLEGMARVDPQVAQRWAKEAGPRYENIVRTTMAEQLAATDADEALTLLAAVDNTSAYFALKGLTERFLKTDARKALRFAEEAVVRTRTLEQPRRTWSLAEIGTLVRQLGKEETGRQLIAEAAEMADKLGAQEYQALARGLVAQALAPYDLERAHALLKPLTEPNDKMRFAQMVATATLKDDPSLPPRVRMQIAYHMGATDPVAAVRIVNSIQGDAKVKAEAYSWVAVAVAPRDKKLADSLIDRSLAIYVDESEKLRSWSNNGGPSVFAARVAGLAQKIGYPDMESIIARVLAVRQTNYYESPARVIESHLATAMILALTDPATARQILHAIEPQSAAIGTGYSSIRRRYWLPAWALADLPHAVELFDRELAGLQEKDTIDLQDNGMTGMIAILTIPPPERAQHLLQFYGAFWFPGEE
ncbi:MAG TPA: sigma-70 family RNA polymerase sigma factor, partial [Gemmataceae bacterium]|nr:sigma-70 family RNA polymerase sigma factor [Gemmataceae bacterium]